MAKSLHHTPPIPTPLLPKPQIPSKPSISLKSTTPFTSPSFPFPHKTPSSRRLIASPAPNTSGGDVGVVSKGLVEGLEGVEVVGLDGKAVKIVELWSERRAVLGFARHFGCIFCQKRADLFASKKDAMDKAGVIAVIIGPGSVEQAKAFSAETKFKGEIYADPTHSSYDVLNFISGFTATFTPGSGLKIVQLYMEGYRQNWGLSFQKDTVTRGGWQQGGILVAGPGKSNILYLHKDKEAGDDPDVEEVLKACCSS